MITQCYDCRPCLLVQKPECTEFNSKGRVFSVEKAHMGSLVASSICALMCESLEGGTIDKTFVCSRMQTQQLGHFRDTEVSEDS